MVYVVTALLRAKPDTADRGERLFWRSVGEA